MAIQDHIVHTNVGELSSALYTYFLGVYGDEELATLAASTTVTDLCAQAAVMEPSARRDEVEAA